MEEINLEFLYDKPLLESELKEEDEDDTEDILEIENNQRLEESLNITSNLEIIKEKEEKRLSDIEKCKKKI